MNRRTFLLCTPIAVAVVRLTPLPKPVLPDSAFRTTPITWTNHFSPLTYQDLKQAYSDAASSGSEPQILVCPPEAWDYVRRRANHR